MRGLKLIALAMFVFGLVPSQDARAQAVVYDPTNFAQNVLSAARALEQIQNQVTQIEQAARMLRQNPLQLSPELSRELEQTRALVAAGEGLAFEIEQLSEDMRVLYPETWEQFSLSEIASQTDDWRSETRASLERAMRAQAEAARSAGRAQAHIESALDASQGADGQTGATQAGNQLLGVNAAQLAQIHILLAAQGRALETERMERLAREQRGQEIQRRAFPRGLTPRSTPARSAF